MFKYTTSHCIKSKKNKNEHPERHSIIVAGVGFLYVHTCTLYVSEKTTHTIAAHAFRANADASIFRDVSFSRIGHTGVEAKLIFDSPVGLLAQRRWSPLVDDPIRVALM